MLLSSAYISSADAKCIIARFHIQFLRVYSILLCRALACITAHTFIDMFNPTTQLAVLYSCMLSQKRLVNVWHQRFYSSLTWLYLSLYQHRIGSVLWHFCPYSLIQFI